MDKTLEELMTYFADKGLGITVYSNPFPTANRSKKFQVFLGTVIGERKIADTDDPIESIKRYFNINE